MRTLGRRRERGRDERDPALLALDRVELLVALEHKIGAPVDETAFAGAKTIAATRPPATKPTCPR